MANRLMDNSRRTHSRRHLFASWVLRRNRDLTVVQDMFGHASPATKRISVATDEAERRRTVDHRILDDREHSS